MEEHRGDHSGTDPSDIPLQRIPSLIYRSWEMRGQIKEPKGVGTCSIFVPGHNGSECWRSSKYEWYGGNNPPRERHGTKIEEVPNKCHWVDVMSPWYPFIISDSAHFPNFGRFSRAFSSFIHCGNWLSMPNREDIWKRSRNEKDTRDGSNFGQFVPPIWEGHLNTRMHSNQMCLLTTKWYGHCNAAHLSQIKMHF